MAILLVMDEDRTHNDPAKDARGCWKRGYVVECFEDDRRCVEKPAPPFIIVRVPGLSKAEAEAKYMAPVVEKRIVDVGGKMEARDVMLCRRAVVLDLEAVSTQAKKPVETARAVSLDVAKLVTCERSVVRERKP